MGLNRTQLMFTRAHAALYRASGGRLGARIGHLEQVLLTTTGRKTGQPRTTPLAATPDGDRLILVASNNGDDHDPLWFRNLVAHPDVVVQRGPRRVEMVARVAEGAERERAWALAVANNPGYAKYESRTSRVIPVIVCEEKRAG